LVAKPDAPGMAPKSVLIERRGEHDVLLVSSTMLMTNDQLRALAPEWRVVER
jgi:hypothetical protein